MPQPASHERKGSITTAEERPTRRTLLEDASVALAALAVPALPLAGARADHPPPGRQGDAKPMPFQFGKEPTRVRKSFYDLTDDEVRLFCLAVGHMRNGSPGKPLPVDH